MYVYPILLFADVSEIDKSVVRSDTVNVINDEVFIYIIDDKCFEDESMCIWLDSLSFDIFLDSDVSIY